jgi:hypothetical protein
LSPAITVPTVNDPTITVTAGTYLTGSTTFTLNQAGAQTITLATNGTSANTVSTLVARDGTGNFSAGTITASLTGTASIATAVTTVPTNAPTSANYYPTFVTLGTAANQNVLTDTSLTYNPNTNTLTVGTLAYTSLSPAITVNDPTITVTAGTYLSGSTSFTLNQAGAQTITLATNATSANTASTLVARDASGNFSAGTITASLTGTASQATNSTNVGVTIDTTTITCYMAFVNNTTGNTNIRVNTNLVYQPTTNILVNTGSIAVFGAQGQFISYDRSSGDGYITWADNDEYNFYNIATSATQLRIRSNGCIQSIATANTINGMIETNYGSLGDRYGMAQDTDGNLRFYIADTYVTSKFTFCRATAAGGFTDTASIDYAGNFGAIGSISALNGFYGDFYGNLQLSLATTGTYYLCGAPIALAGFQPIDKILGASVNLSTGILTSTAGFNGALTGNVTGNATTATTATNATNVGLTLNAAGAVVRYLAFTPTAVSGNSTLELDTGLTYLPSTGVLTSTTFVGALTGNVTGSLFGNATSATSAIDCTNIATTAMAYSTSTTVYPLCVANATAGNQPTKVTPAFSVTFSPILQTTVTATNFSGLCTQATDVNTTNSTTNADYTIPFCTYNGGIRSLLVDGNGSPILNYNPGTKILTSENVKVNKIYDNISSIGSANAVLTSDGSNTLWSNKVPIQTTSGSFSAVASFTVGSAVFSSAYNSYKVVIRFSSATANQAIRFNFATSAGLNVTSNYIGGKLVNATSTVASATSTSLPLTDSCPTHNFVCEFEIFDVATGQPYPSYKATNNPHVTGTDTNYGLMSVNGLFKSATTFDRFGLTIASGTMSGAYYIYGIPNV